MGPDAEPLASEPIDEILEGIRLPSARAEHNLRIVDAGRHHSTRGRGGRFADDLEFLSVDGPLHVFEAVLLVTVEVEHH